MLNFCTTRMVSWSFIIGWAPPLHERIKRFDFDSGDRKWPPLPPSPSHHTHTPYTATYIGRWYNDLKAGTVIELNTLIQLFLCPFYHLAPPLPSPIFCIIHVLAVPSCLSWLFTKKPPPHLLPSHLPFLSAYISLLLLAIKVYRKQSTQVQWRFCYFFRYNI